MPKMRAGRKPSLGHAMYYTLSGLSPRSEGQTAKARAKDLIKQSGMSTKKAAQAVGVSRETMRRWAKGSQEPSEEHAAALEEAQREARMKSRRVQKMIKSVHGAEDSGSAEGGGGGAPEPSGGAGLRIKATVVVSSDTRTRWLDVAGSIPRSAMEKVIRELINGGPDSGEAALIDAITRYYFRGQAAHIDSVQEIRY